MPIEPSRLPSGGLLQRILLLALILGAEAIVASLWLDGESLVPKHGALTVLVRTWGSWSVRFGIGFAALFATFSYLKYRAPLAGFSARVEQARIRPALFAAHVFAIVVFGALSAAFFGSGSGNIPTDLLAAAWLLAALAAVGSIALAVLPWSAWLELVRTTGNLWIFASVAAAAACWAGMMSQALWAPATKVTYGLVKLLLAPLVPNMIVQPAIMRIGTPRFAVRISPECSGLEGVALLLIFGGLWLLLFRKQSRFPQALLLLPAAVVVLFLLNAVRIALLVMIGHAGAPEIAARGFHSQAGWIAFNSVAFGFSVAARRLPWFSLRTPDHAIQERGENPAAPYLVPFLAILAAGMISRAASGQFEWLYPLRFVAAAPALWALRRRYAELDWKAGWLAPVTGAVVFVVWISLDRLAAGTPAGHGMPAALARAPEVMRVVWIAFRVLAAVATVPIAEELAFRGYLLRRLIAADFETVSFRAFTWFSLLASSLVFGMLHGERWLAGTVAGVLYAFAAMRSGRLGDAVAAHATTNLLLAAYVLALERWSLW